VRTVSTIPAVNTPADPRWLSGSELHAWRSLMKLMARLPAALEVQLQRHAQLSFLEYCVLAALSDAPDRRLRISELAELTNAELSRMSHLICRLERRELVRREPDPYNRRYTRALLTEAGMAHLVRAAPAHVAEVRTLLFDAIDGRDLALLDGILERVNNRIGSRD
jgi:DNA-binding MarR family transcriptional regulator